MNLTTRLPWRLWLGLIYAVTILGYMMDGVENGRGLGGILVDLGMRVTGAVSPSGIGLFAAMLLIIPGWIVLAGATASTEQREKATPARSILFDVINVVVLAAIVAGGPALWYWFEARADEADHQRPIVDLDLSRPDAIAGAAPGIADLHGYLEPRNATEITRALRGGGLASSVLYMPLVAPGWKPGQPVAVFVATAFTPGNFPRRFFGRIDTGGLPRHVKSALEDAGFRVDPAHVLVHEVKVEAGRLVETDRSFEHLRWIALALALIVIVPGAIWVWGRGPASAPEPVKHLGPKQTR